MTENVTPTIGPPNQATLTSEASERNKVSGDQNVTRLTTSTVTFTSKYDMVKELHRNHPDQAFMNLDIVQQAGTTKDVARVYVHRLYKEGLIIKPKKGLSQWNPSGAANLLSLISSKELHFENIRVFPPPLINKPFGPETLQEGGRGGAPVTFAINECNRFVTADPVTSNGQVCAFNGAPTSRDGFPWVLPTNQRVDWLVYQNGQEEVRLSASGGPPFSGDAILAIFHHLESLGKGFSKEWWGRGVEVNADFLYHRVEGPVTVGAFESFMVKWYQHTANSMRLEITDFTFHTAEDLSTAATSILMAKVTAGDHQRLQRVGEKLAQVGERAERARQATINISDRLERHRSEEHLLGGKSHKKKERKTARRKSNA